MEQNLPISPKKFWTVFRLFYFMLRKGVSKNKLWLDLTLIIKRAKLAGKSLQNLLFHHHHHWAAFAVPRPSHHLSTSVNSPPPPGEYECSCTTSPSASNHQFLFSGDQRNADLDFNAAVWKAMEMIQSGTPSPVLPGFGRSPVVRQLRVTDSPFPVSGGDDDEDSRVDEAAEQFIMKFYSDLRRQKRISGGEN